LRALLSLSEKETNMKAIEVRILPCTDRKPTRLVAETDAQRLVMSKNSADDASGDTGSGFLGAQYVAQALADKMGWGPIGHGGGTKRGFVFCFPPKA
jgi:hypothetical protein